MELNDQWLKIMPTFPRLIPEAAAYNVPPAFSGDLSTRRGPKATLRSPALQSASTNNPSASPPMNTNPKPIKGHALLNEKDRRYSPLTHRLGGVAMIIIAAIVGAMLAAIPLIGPVLFIGCLILGIMGNNRSRRIAVVLEKERSVPGLHL